MQPHDGDAAVAVLLGLDPDHGFACRVSSSDKSGRTPGVAQQLARQFVHRAFLAHQARLMGKEGPVYEQMGKLLRDAGVRPLYTVRDAGGKPVVGVETQEFRNGAVSIVGLHENPQMRVNELGPPEFKSNKRFEEPKALTMQLPDALYAYDLRAGKSLGRVKQVAFTLDPWEPAIYAFSRTPLPELRVAAPAKLRAAQTAASGSRSPERPRRSTCCTWTPFSQGRLAWVSALACKTSPAISSAAS